MKEFFDVFLFTFKVIIAFALMLISIFSPIVLGALVSPWFILSYIVSIPLLVASISYLMDICDYYTYL